jgi:4-deoxy-L-threo-5-hexosulose-uronate ketol-isomerase
MDIRYSANQKDVKRYTTQELRDEFLIQNIFKKNDVTAVYSHVDRIVTMGAMPAGEVLPLDKNIDSMKNFGVDYMLERRELGIINIGAAGTVTCDGEKYHLEHFDCLYVSMGTKEVTLESDDANNPAKFYMCSTPAHKPCPTKLIEIKSANKSHLGSPKTSNERTINQFIHPAVLETCQLSMGLTILKEGSIWNTMPSHTHERRMEVYFYFDIADDNVVFHFMGEPSETRHIVMRNEEAVIGPSWSIHTGVGTSAYTFIWAMAGENRTFTDMDDVAMSELK